MAEQGTHKPLVGSSNLPVATDLTNAPNRNAGRSSRAFDPHVPERQSLVCSTGDLFSLARSCVLSALPARRSVWRICVPRPQRGLTPRQPTPRTVQNADVGTFMYPEGWKVTLIEAPKQMKMIGGEVKGCAASPGKCGLLQRGQDPSDDDVTAKGSYVIAPSEL